MLCKLGSAGQMRTQYYCCGSCQKGLCPSSQSPGHRTPGSAHTPRGRERGKHWWGQGTHLIRKVGLDLVIQLPAEDGEKEGPVSRG